MTAQSTTTATPSAALSLGTIDLTPTWAGLMPALIAILSDPESSATGRQIATEQLKGLAAGVDRINAENKAARA